MIEEVGVLDRAVVSEKVGFVVWRANGWFLGASPPLSEQLNTAHALLL